MKHGLFALLLFVLALTGAACSDDDTNTADQLPDLGKSWTRVAMPSSFTNRELAGTAVLNGRLYIAAGPFAPERGDDCWSSGNGTVWTMETNDLGVSGLRYAAMAAHEGKLWLHGGVDSYGGVQYTVRSSSNGRIWTSAATANVRYMHSMLAFDNKLWTIAGRQRVIAGDIITNGVASSVNGIDWTDEPVPGFAPRLNPGTAVHAGKMWVIGGALNNFNNPPYTNDVWSSPDGKTWTRVTASAPFCARTVPVVVAAGNRLYVIGGYLESGYGTNDVWKSHDGVTWEQVAVTTPFPLRSFFSGAAFDNGLYIIAGHVDGTVYQTNDIWFSK